jgi:uncharacterized membrane protein (DUF2068 family)
VAKDRDRIVTLIGLFKLLKAALLLAIGVAGLVADPGEIAEKAREAGSWIGILPGRHTFSHLLEKLGSADIETARKVAVVALCYGAVFLVEGLGLLYRRRWAEWLTVVVTASFIPFEIYECAQHLSASKIIALLLNLAILIYLVRRRIQSSHGIISRRRFI